MPKINIIYHAKGDKVQYTNYAKNDQQFGVMCSNTCFNT